jgi:CubicO group peptidase (beta-lactamase class C family)
MLVMFGRAVRHRALHHILLALATAGTLHSQTAAPADMSAILQAIVTQNKIPGMAALVLRGDQIVAQGAAGVRRRGSPEPITLNDQFQINSATKAMTATLAALAVEQGKLSWNTTLGDIFTGTAKQVNDAWKPVTLTQLLQHRAGVPNELTRKNALLRIYLSRKSVVEQRQRVAATLLSHKPAYPPGSRFVYSSLGYILVGVMLEKATGRSWEDLVREQLWQPLGMKSGGFGPPGAKGPIDQPWGHWGAAMVGHPVQPDGLWAHLNTPLFWGPGGNSRMTVADWSRFISLHLRGDPANPHFATALLTPNTFATLHRAPAGIFYQAGWILTTKPWANGHRPADLGRVLSSQGDNYFWHSEAWIAPEIDFAVLIVTNQGGPAANDPASKASAQVLEKLVREFGPGVATTP